MLHNSRLTTICMLLVVLLVAAPLTLAQESFGLSEDDFTLFSSQNFDADAVSFDYTLNFSVAGTPDGDVAADLSGAGAFGVDAAGQPVGSFSISGAVTDAGTSENLDFQFLLVDNVLYMNMGDGSGWIGQPADEMLSGLSSMSPVPVDPSDLMSGGDDAGAASAMGGAVEALTDPEVAEYITITRLDDSNGLAHFQVAVDLSGFVSSEEFNEMMTAAGEMSGDESMAGMGMMLAMLFQNMSLTLDEFIDASSGRVGQAVVNFSMTMDPTMMAAMGGAESAAEVQATPINIALSLDISNLQYDQPVEVTAPADAMMIPSAAEMEAGE